MIRKLIARWPHLSNASLQRQTCAFLVCGICAWATFYERLRSQEDFFDDAFIYLHVAANVVESWTAQYFPTSGNRGLLASSPLKLLTLLPGTAVAQTVGLGRTAAGATLTMALSVLIGAAASGAVLWKISKLPLLASAVFLASPVLACAYDGALQMEGVLVFCGTAIGLSALRSRDPRSTAIALVWLSLTRIELGLAYGASALIAHVGTKSNNETLRKTSLYAALAALLWFCLSASWKTWPVPTTYATKILTAQHAGAGRVAEAIGTRFLAQFSAEPVALSSLGDPMRNALGWLALGALTSLLSWANTARAFISRLCFFTLSLGMVALGGANFIWYYDNVFLILAGAVVEALDLDALHCRTVPARVGAMLLLVCILCGAGYRGSVRTKYNLEFSADGNAKTMANMYRRLGQFGRGPLFYSHSTRPFRLLSCEIGMIAYFAGSEVWFQDLCGLAQPGELALGKKLWALRAYPDELFSTASQELEGLASKVPSLRGVPARSIHWSVPDLSRCMDYGIPPSKVGNVCLE